MFFCHGQKRDYLSRASLAARGATKNLIDNSHDICSPQHNHSLKFIAFSTRTNALTLYFQD